MKAGSLEECDELTSPGIWLATDDLTPDSEGKAEFSLTVPVAPKERVCIVALADCSLTRTRLTADTAKGQNLFQMFQANQHGFTEML
eukprot:COSAG02_NODE_48253_length_335_cov_0.661017_1_plen_86_part_10